MEFASKLGVFGNPFLDSNLPLDQCEGDSNSENIEFAMTAIYEMGILDKLKRPGDFAQSESPFCLYHSHALWSYRHRTTRYEDGTFGMSLVGIGPELVESRGSSSNPYEKEFAALYKPQQQPPELLAAAISFRNSQNGVEIATFEFERADNDIWKCTKHFTREELAAFGDPAAFIYFTMRIIISRSYFDLPKLLKDTSTAASGTKRTVECILRGDKPDGWDFRMRVGREDDNTSLPHNYYVHSATFARASKYFQVMRRQNPSHNSCYIPELAPEDMPVPDVFARLFPQWERAVCEQVLALDKSDPRSFSPLIRLLIFSLSNAVPLPSARTATLTVFAEMALLHKTAGVCFEQYRIDHKSIIGRAFAAHDYAPSTVEDIVNVMFVLVASVRLVTKTGLATKKKDSEVAAPPISSTAVSPPRDFSTPTVVVIDDDDDATDDTDSIDKSDEVVDEIVEEPEVAEQNNSRCPIS
ncbi:hypothetical protein PRIPAC_76408 [Pristionchus pacificus]|uniref:Uncharacterized protein n=1 Tax=Pristionchus pacificus TaxID=54126 RepID=A0A2A6C565_PRIPA|nr:hypothetical protein PRIPAC_76408 [Pristionchus pacificus]|eukprot:PDM73362.1 hypothetical protein PRIPAC_40718 [Pristionchus pacificus]